MGTSETLKKAGRAFDYIPFAMLLLVVIGGVVGWQVYTSYSTSFGEDIKPRAVVERTAVPGKEAPKEVQIQASAEAEARAEWGQLGDYFGGTLNPIFGFISVVGLFLTILYQSREMSLSTEELKNSAEALKAQNDAIRLQNFEQTFFSMLRLLEEVVGGCKAYAYRGQPPREGRQAIETFGEWMLGGLPASAQTAPPEYVDHIRGQVRSLSADKSANHFRRYARTLAAVLAHMDHGKVECSSIYPTILRGLLSSEELLLIYFLSFDDEWGGLKSLVEKYGVLAHMDAAKTGAGDDYASFFDRSAFHA